MGALRSASHALEHFGRKIVVFQILQASFNNFTEIVGFAAPGLRHKKVDPLLGLVRERYCGSHDEISI